MSGRKLQWPENRGLFRDEHPERVTDPPFQALGGEVVTFEDDDRADHYLDRGWVPAEDDADPVEEPGQLDDGPETWEEFQQLGYQDRVAAVEAGDVDHLLERAAEDDGSTNVQEAVAERQAELSETEG